MDVVFISLETLNTLLDSLGMVVMEGATCTLTRSSLGSIVLENVQWLRLHQKIHQNLKFFTILWLITNQAPASLLFSLIISVTLNTS